MCGVYADKKKQIKLDLLDKIMVYLCYFLVSLSRIERSFEIAYGCENPIFVCCFLEHWTLYLKTADLIFLSTFPLRSEPMVLIFYGMCLCN